MQIRQITLKATQTTNHIFKNTTLFRRAPHDCDESQGFLTKPKKRDRRNLRKHGQSLMFHCLIAQKRRVSSKKQNLSFCKSYALSYFRGPHLRGNRVFACLLSARNLQNRISPNNSLSSAQQIRKNTQFMQAHVFAFAWNGQN